MHSRRDHKLWAALALPQFRPNPYLPSLCYNITNDKRSGLRESGKLSIEAKTTTFAVGGVEPLLRSAMARSAISRLALVTAATAVLWLAIVWAVLLP